MTVLDRLKDVSKYPVGLWDKADVALVEKHGRHLLAVAREAQHHDCATHAETSDEGTGFCRLCEALAPLLREETRAE